MSNFNNGDCYTETMCAKDYRNVESWEELEFNYSWLMTYEV